MTTDANPIGDSAWVIVIDAMRQANAPTSAISIVCRRNGGHVILRHQGQALAVSTTRTPLIKVATVNAAKMVTDRGEAVEAVTAWLNARKAKR